MFETYLDFLNDLVSRSKSLFTEHASGFSFMNYLKAIGLQLEWLLIIILSILIVVAILGGVTLLAHWLWIKVMRYVFRKYQQLIYQEGYCYVKECTEKILNSQDTYEDEKCAITEARDIYVKTYKISTAHEATDEERTRLYNVQHEVIPKIWLTSVIVYIILYMIAFAPIAVAFFSVQFPNDSLNEIMVMSYFITAIIGVISVAVVIWWKDVEIFVRDEAFIETYERLEKAMNRRKAARKKEANRQKKKEKKAKKDNK